MMQKYCPVCGKYSYSAAPETKWLCPECGNDLTKYAATLPKNNKKEKSKSNLKLVRIK